MRCVGFQAFDIVPANLKPSDGLAGEVLNARIVGDRDGRVRVWVAGRMGEGVILKRTLQATAVRPIGYKRFEIDTEAGTFEISKGGGCGCSSPLTKFNPRTWQA